MILIKSWSLDRQMAQQKFFADLIDRFKLASNDAGSSNLDNGPKVMTLGAALESAFADPSKRKKFVSEVLEPVFTKIVKTPDIGTLRMASISDRMAMKRNEETPFLNFLESQDAGVAVARDYQYQFDEWNLGFDTAAIWDVQGDLPAEARSVRPRRSNTITAIGNTMLFSELVLDMVAQQANIDLLAREIDNEVVRIRRTMNSTLLSNTEVKLETGAAPNFPQLGGFITRSTDYGVNLSGGDFTRTALQGRIDAIANYGSPEGLGYGRPLLCFTNAHQLQVVRDIIVSEYNGIYPTDRVAFESSLRSRLRDFRVPVQTVFESLPGPVIPFVLDPMLPANTSILFVADLPRLVKMYLGGVAGPYVLTRPTTQLTRLDVAFDLFSLEDPLVASRSVFSATG